MSASRRRSALALLLLVPVPSIGALAAFVIAPGPGGAAVYAACKLWLAGLPVAWHLLVEGAPPSLSPLPRGRAGRALALGILLGLALGACVLAAFELFGRDWVDPERLRRVVFEAGLDSRGRYLAFAAYLIAVNSLLEEVAWRWFVFRRCEDLWGARVAVVAAAMLFTLHHGIALAAELGPAAGAAAAAGVFAGGLAWSWCYLRFRSIWPGYASHAVVDLVALALGWRLLFG